MGEDIGMRDELEQKIDSLPMDEVRELLDQWMEALRKVQDLPTIDRSIDAIGPKSLEELYIMNGSKFPFTAVKVAFGQSRANIYEVPLGTTYTFVQDVGIGNSGYPVYMSEDFHTITTDNRAWQFADPDFKE